MELTQEEKQFIIDIFKIVEIKGNYQYWQGITRQMETITNKLIEQRVAEPNGTEPELTIAD